MIYRLLSYVFAALLSVMAAAPARGTSLSLNGVNGYAFASDAATFDFSASFTIELQFESNVAQTGCLLAKFHQNSGTTTDDSYYILTQPDGSIQSRIQTDAQLVTLTAPGNVHDGNWHHVALVYDRTAGVAELYLDAQLGASQPLSGQLRDTEEALRLGALRSSGALANFFNGKIDELRFWNVARRGEQASCLRQVTLLLDTPGLVSYYRFDEGSGTTAFDRVTPFENITFISGATFAVAEPLLASRLDGPGVCRCGDVSGVLTMAMPAVTLVGDTVYVPAGDSLALTSHALTVDSSVSFVDVPGKLVVTGTAQDSSYILGQGSPAADAVILLRGADTTRFNYLRVSGFAGRPIVNRGPLNIVNSRFSGNGGALQVSGFASVAQSLFEQHTGYVIQADSGVVQLTGTTFRGNAGGISVTPSAAGVCRVTGDSLVFDANTGTDGAALALLGNAANPVEAHLARSTFINNSATESVVLIRRARHVTGETTLLDHCVFHDNSANATVVCDTAYANTAIELRNLTVALNSSGLRLDAPATLRNSIVVGNGTDQIAGTNPVVAYCLTSDAEFHGPGGSFYADPLFQDYFARDFHLTAGSPAINRGDPNALYDDDDGTRADIGAFTSQNFAPTLQSILDVPHDNGRQVMIQWLPSAGDDNRQGIAEYRIYREVNLIANFELLATIPAAQLDGYGQIVSTLADSNQNGVPYYTYFVRAQSVNPLAFWDTPLDSGYSVDNLAPGAPALFASQENDDARLTWPAVADTDVAYYAVYRAEIEFDPDTVTASFATTADTTYLDSTLNNGGAWYAVRAVDINGNVSAASNVANVSFFLAAPQHLTVMPFSGVAWLRWSAVPGATGYQVLRMFTPDGPEDLLATTPETTYLVPMTAPRMFFRVVAIHE